MIYPLFHVLYKICVLISIFTERSWPIYYNIYHLVNHAISIKSAARKLVGKCICIDPISNIRPLCIRSVIQHQ